MGSGYFSQVISILSLTIESILSNCSGVGSWCPFSTLPVFVSPEFSLLWKLITQLLYNGNWFSWKQFFLIPQSKSLLKNKKKKENAPKRLVWHYSPSQPFSSIGCPNNRKQGWDVLDNAYLKKPTGRTNLQGKMRFHTTSDDHLWKKFGCKFLAGTFKCQ